MEKQRKVVKEKGEGAEERKKEIRETNPKFEEVEK